MADYFCVFMIVCSCVVLRVAPPRPPRRVVGGGGGGAYVLSLLLPMRIYAGYISFCPLFSDVFNTKSAIFIHQSLTLPQKNDSCEGWF